ncbi:MAG: hypothetical protein PHP59_07070 [Methanofollis sp.]|uniref:hypothetical protein n=1 Tax=Methanofollis sp. TaxID=2052835 RepID=UPI00261F61D5|nr:hypothetical protein [Methanofollis sp.]MDD4255123.1 hypothetical protein [Methanofollis sp.]
MTTVQRPNGRNEGEMPSASTHRPRKTLPFEVTAKGLKESPFRTTRRPSPVISGGIRTDMIPA